MKKILKIFIIFVLAALVFSQAVLSLASGRVIYRQNFSDVSDLSEIGFEKGADGEWGFYLGVSDGEMIINNYNDEKAYVIMPEIDLPETYTVEVTYRFTDIFASNAYTGVMLTCSGERPTNITSAVTRANGICDGFGKFGDKLAEKIADGNKVKITIPIENENLHEIKASCDGLEETLIRENILSVTPEKMGFVVRNASVAISEIRVINGAGYESIYEEESAKELKLSKAEESFEGDFRGDFRDESKAQITAPATGDFKVGYFIIACGACAAVLGAILRRKKQY